MPVLWKRGGPLRLTVKLIQMILSLIQKELIDWKNVLPGLKASTFLTGYIWEDP